MTVSREQVNILASQRGLQLLYEALVATKQHNRFEPDFLEQARSIGRYVQAQPDGDRQALSVFFSIPPTHPTAEP